MHDLCVVTDLAWDFGPPPGEELSIERRVLRAEAVALLNSLARLSVSASLVAKHAGLVLKLLGDTYGGFVPALIPPSMPPTTSSITTTTTTTTTAIALGDAGSAVPLSRAIASPALVLALLKLLQILAGSTQAGGRKALFKAACATLLKDKPGGFVFEEEMIVLAKSRSFSKGRSSLYMYVNIKTLR